MEVRFESMVCLWDDKIPTMFLEFVNLLTLTTSEEQLRRGVKEFAEKHELDKRRDSLAHGNTNHPKEDEHGT